MPGGFRYVKPSTLEEALVEMAQDGAMILAGGQTLIPRLAAGMGSPKILVDIGGLSELRKIEADGNTISIGSMVRLGEAAASILIKNRCRLLADCAGKTATPAIRNRGTLVGNLAWGDPASQLAVVAVALGAVFRLCRRDEFRHVAAEAFFVSANVTAVGPDELVSHLFVDGLGERTGSGLSFVSLRQNSRALATATAVITIDNGGIIERVSLAIGGCGDVPRKCRSVEAVLLGLPFEAAPDAAAAALIANPPPLGAGVLDSEYAVLVLPALMRRAIRDASSDVLNGRAALS